MILPKMNKICWTAIIGFGTILALIGGLYQVDDRYAKADDLFVVKETIEEKTIQTFEAFQTKQQSINDSVLLQILNIQYDNLIDRYYKLKNELKEFPTDEDLKQEFEEVIKRKEEIKVKRDRILEDTK